MRSVLEIVRSPYGQAVIFVTMAIMLAVVGYYVVRRFRDSTESKEDPSQLMTDFREMHQHGALTEAEYRTIKSVLAEKLQHRGKDDEPKT